MNEQKIKENMKESSEKYVVKLTSEQIIKEYEKRHEPRKKFNWNKLFISLTPVVAAGVILAVVLPTTLNPNPTIPSGSSDIVITDPVEIEQTLNQKNVNKLAFEATTATQAAIDLSNPVSMIARRAISQTEKNELKEVLPSIDLILTNRSTFETTLKESSNPDYAYDLTISYVGTDDEKYEYTLSFNILKEKVEHDDDETERKVYYKGISTIYDTSYEFLAVSEEEHEDDEVETEISMTLYQNTSKSSYIKVNQSTEVEEGEQEESFEYEIYNSGRLVREFEISTELEGGEKEIEVEINDEEYYVEILEDGSSTKFKFMTDDDDDDDDDDDKEEVGIVVFEKVKTTNPETGTVVVSYEEVTL